MASKKISKKELEDKIKSQAQIISILQSENLHLKEEAILAQKKIEEQLSLKEIICNVPGNIFWKDLKGRYLGCNYSAAKACRVSSPDEIIGKTDRDIMPASSIYKPVRAADTKVLKTGKMHTFEEKGLKGETFLSHKIPLRNPSNEIIGILGISVDITERKKMEEELRIAKEKAEAATIAKSQFLAIINHELRTPVASMIGLLNFLKQGGLSKSEEKKITQDIDNCAKHLQDLVNDVLDFSRLEAGKFDLYKQAIPLESLIYEISSFLIPLAEQKGLKLIVKNNAKENINLLTDARVLKQILINLTNNAIKFTEKGQVIIQINVLNKLADKMKLEIAVIDTGLGIPKNKFQTIFEPFQQLENAYTRKSSRSGTGLGLSIVKKLAQAIHATLKIESKVGVGSRFSLTGEFETIDQSDKRIPVENASPTRKNRKLKTLTPIYPGELKDQPFALLIEDDPIIQYIHKKMLLDLGCKVTIAKSGQEALKKLGNHDIIFADISLPDVNGLEVIKMIRKHHSGKHTPIVALTAHDGIEEKTASLKAGADSFRSKPISHDNLKTLILRYLKENP